MTRWGLGTTLVLLSGTLAQAQYIQKLPESAVDSYRLESNYGPEIAVLNPLFPRDNKVELSLGGVYSPVSTIHNYYAFNGALLYHINHRHALEPVWFQYNQGKETAFINGQVRDKMPASVGRNSLGVEIPKWIYSFSYLFSPYYSKMHITETSVWHFDTYLGAGLAIVNTEEKNLAGGKGEKHQRFGGAATAGMRFLMGSRYGLRLELRDFIYRGKNLGSEDTQHSLQMAVNFSIFFGAFPDYTSL
jgi:outer membrane beta-barrel protein